MNYEMYPFAIDPYEHVVEDANIQILIAPVKEVTGRVCQIHLWYGECPQEMQLVFDSLINWTRGRLDEVTFNISTTVVIANYPAFGALAEQHLHTIRQMGARAIEVWFLSNMDYCAITLLVRPEVYNRPRALSAVSK